MARPKKAAPVAPKAQLTPLPDLAKKFRDLADLADKGHVGALLIATVLVDENGGAATTTAIHDNEGLRALLGWTASNLVHLLQQTEAHRRTQAPPQPVPAGGQG